VNVPWASSGTPASGTHTLIALGWNQLAHAAAVKNQPSSWHAPQFGHDIVMITNGKVCLVVQPLVRRGRARANPFAVST